MVLAMTTPARLKSWLTSRDWSTADLARALKLNHATQVHNWVNGSSRPPAWARSALEDVTDRLIRVDDWLTEDEQAKLAAARAR